MADTRLEVLIKTLADRTARSRLGWTAASREDTFVWSGTNASVMLYTKDNDGQAPWMLRLIDKDGRIIEEGEYTHSVYLGEMVGGLYADARSEALDISATIDGLLDDLS
jgi:hypothetical protein